MSGRVDGHSWGSTGAQPARSGCGSIKVKFSVVIVAAVVVTLVVNEIGLELNFRAGFRAFIAAAIALLMVQLLARGMTSPLREMEQAATGWPTATTRQSWSPPSADEVGELAVAFNHMAAELAEPDRQRRDLVANVSHELRTPISALRATLENLVDGVVPATPELLRTMLSQTERLQRLVTQLLDLSRLESGGSPLHRQPVQRRPTSSTRSPTRPGSTPATSQSRSTSSPEDLDADGDPERVHQVVANLVENAVALLARQHGRGGAAQPRVRRAAR